MKYALALILSAMSPGYAMAEVIADTLGPSNSFISRTAAGIGQFDGMVLSQGAEFTIPSDFDYLLDFIEIAISVDFPESGAFRLDVMSDDLGVPGDVVESFRFTGITARFGTDEEIVRGNSTGGSRLQAGENYWLVGSVPEDEKGVVGLMAWHLNSQEIELPRALRRDDGPWQRVFDDDPNSDDNDSTMTYRVAATVVPEPSSSFLLISGAMMMGLIPRRELAFPCVLTKRKCSPT